jgi:succinate dehydrogenase/fumarate reductase flavoprotein subunit
MNSPSRTAQQTIHARSVLIATGGYASDFTNTSLLSKYRPDLVHLPTTNGAFTTGDGIKFASSIGADVVDMANVQVHPTGFVDPKHVDAKVKTLCAELLRGVGGILLDSAGQRFADELGTRDYIVKRYVGFHLCAVYVSRTAAAVAATGVVAPTEIAAAGVTVVDYCCGNDGLILTTSLYLS